MNDITLLDNYGNVLHYFTQWDINQMIYIEESGFAKAPQFHFQNLKTATAYVVQSSMDSSGKVSVMVPNELTVVSYPIDIYIYVSDSDSSQTVYHTTIPVYPRKQPNDLIYEDNMEFITISELEERIEKLKDILDGFAVSAGDIAYDNSVSGLDATNVQDALDELVEKYVFVDDSGGGGDTPTDAEKVSNAKAVIEAAIAAMNVSNDTTQSDIQAVVDNALMNAGITDVVATVGGINKNNATTSESGLITGSVSITSGTESDSVAINKTITKLPESDADKVSNAKEIIEKAIKNMTVTNDTTQSDIQTVVDNALSNAGIIDVTATVSNISKSNATSSSTGVITGSVNITCGNESDSVSINKIIAQLEETDEEKVANAKEVIERAINNMTVTNDTTKADIQSVVNNALSNAGITGVTATVGTISKTNATGSASGSLTGKISISCGTASDNVSISKTITQLKTVVVHNKALSNLSAGRTQMDATTVGNYALFGGGMNTDGDTVATVDVYDGNLTKKSSKSLSQARCEVAATTVGDYALFGGGGGSSTYATVDAFNSSLSRTNADDLSGSSYARGKSATTVGNYAIFAGGSHSVTSVGADAYDTSLVKTTLDDLSVARYTGSATTIGNYALFGGGYYGDAETGIDVYNTSLTKSLASKLSDTSSGRAVSTGKYAYFQLKYNLDVYDASLTKSTHSNKFNLKYSSRSVAALNGCVIILGEGLAYSCDDSLTVELLDTSTVTQESLHAELGTATTIGNYAIFTGGNYGTYNKYVESFTTTVK